MIRGRSAAPVGVRAECEVAARMATRFHLYENVATALFQTFERWDGHGLPNGMAKEALLFLLFIRHERRELIHLNVTANPTAAWIWRQAIEATAWGRQQRHLIRDRDNPFAASLERERRRGFVVVRLHLSA